MNITEKLISISELARQALIDEVSATPKPGLVDKNNCGSHSDMNIDTFLCSADALKPYFYEFAVYGKDTANEPVESILKKARKIGLDAEEAMYKATNGVNTHKGLIFSLGLICIAAGRLLAKGLTVDLASICDTSAMIVKGICETDFSAKRTDSLMTSGERFYKQYGIKGSRGEAESGFETVRLYSYSFLEKCINDSLSKNEALVRTLLKLMSVVTDTNMIKRGGIILADEIKGKSAELIYADLDSIEEFDTQLIKENLSPGGSADLLAVTWFIYNLERKIN